MGVGEGRGPGFLTARTPFGMTCVFLLCGDTGILRFGDFADMGRSGAASLRERESYMWGGCGKALARPCWVSAAWDGPAKKVRSCRTGGCAAPASSRSLWVRDARSKPRMKFSETSPLLNLVTPPSRMVGAK